MSRLREIFTIDYGNWWLVSFYIVILTVFLLGILRPRTKTQWRSAGVAQAWIIALYAEMYGLPLTMYGLAWVTGKSDYATNHFHGHAWAYLFGWGDMGAILCDIVGQLLIVTGAVLAIVGWRQIHRGRGALIRSGLYRRVRHPQYTGFFLFLLGSIINWPTLITLIMLPALLVIYYRLAKQEEADALAQFGDEYRGYQQVSGMFLPRWGETTRILTTNEHE